VVSVYDDHNIDKMFWTDMNAVEASKGRAHITTRKGEDAGFIIYCVIWGSGVVESLLYNTFLLLTREQFMVSSGRRNV